MERCDFASITTIIRNNLLEGTYDNQLEFVETLFSSYADENDACFDMGLVCKWLNGLTKLSPAIGQFYISSSSRQRELATTLEDTILPCLSDSSMVAQQIHDLILQDNSISDRKKDELCRSYPCTTDTESAYFLTDVLCFGMTRPFVKRDVRKPNLLTLGNASPMLKDFIFDEGVPNPCRYFCGREHELSLLHEALIECSKVFLCGIAGIGKSELAKAYAKEHKKEYTNILYMTYTGDLRHDIIDMDFADDLPEDDETVRFRKHNRFMRTLKEDTLLIIDNFNTTSARDEFLSVMLKYRCRILFTTRSLFPGQKTIHLGEISDPETLFRLAANFYSDATQNRYQVEQIIKAVHSHTLAVELASRLLESGILEPQEILEKLQEEKADFSATDKIGITKDGKNQKATYYDHIRKLFSLFHLSQSLQDIMRNLSLIPTSGISARLFGKWMKFQDLNEVNELVESGFVQSRAGNMIALHPMIMEVTISDIPPTITECHILLESIRATCQLHGIDVPYYKEMFQTIENAIDLAGKDDIPFYLLLLEDAFQYMEKYHYEPVCNRSFPK
jgi:hypothetical protein